MKGLKVLTGAGLQIVLTSSAAFAATGESAEGNGLLILMFLGFCALIVVGQLVPAILMLFGSVRGLLGGEAKGAAPASRR